MSLDPRVVKVGITINDVTTWYSDLFIEAKGIKISSTINAACDVLILGLSTETRNFILRETRPNTPNKKRVSVELLVGRESYGGASYYKGDVFRSSATPKPNLGIMLKCITGYNAKSKIVSRSSEEMTKLSQIAKVVAQDNGLSLSFEITDQNIRSYSFTGSASQSLINFQRLSNSDVFVDGGTMFVKEQSKAARSRVIYNVNDGNGNLIESTGTEAGAKIKMLFNPSVNIGSVVNLESELNPQLNGRYILFKVEFEITSRAQPFYLIVEGNQSND